ncbi:TonB-dependent receptor [Dysgonomonas sp. BGC7]|uniref:SusC/RagA family TonB-linked outer membrane protein n=1 Tax=Dysgonomonas sp. BGC7 TaxID=1658008 RepID=UPI0006811CF9|nr:TonB-dependent receptor [Dysgonomonas sp. BGC7]MBD8388942.1 TonB-dependent receptor [Dysgonomonas sp. BGC7]
MKRLLSKRSVALILFILLINIIAIDIYAEENGIAGILQEKTKITGTVVDKDGEPIIGATVVVVGTTQGTNTDLNGKYEIDVPNRQSRLEFRFLGFVTKTETVGNQSQINIVLEEDSKILDEVVVVGYGTQKKATLTGSVTVIGEEMFKDKGTVSNPLQALQGQVAGLRITRSSAAPGEEGWKVSIRGAVSKNATDPLLIIDGVPADGTGELQNLNASDIESINFLKDASAAIYGSKAAGGVILVTTKNPSAGKTKIEYSGSYTYKKVGLQPRLMNLDEWTDGIIQALNNDGYTDHNWIKYANLAKANKGRYIDLTNGKNPDPIPGAFQGVADFVFQDINWTDVLWGGASSTQHNLSASGGNEKSKYRLSLGYLYDEGTLQWGNNSNEQFNARLNNTFQLTDRFSIESVISASRRRQVAPTMINSVLGVSIPQPGLPAATIDGKAYAWGGQRAPNWLAELGGDNELIVTTFNINETFKYQLMKGLDFTGTFGYSTNGASRDEQYNSIEWFSYNGQPHKGDSRYYPTADQSSYKKTNARTDNYSANAYLNYSKSLNEIHNFNLMAGTQYDFKQYDYSGSEARNIMSELEVINGSGTIYLVAPDKYEIATLSYFSRLNYDYKSKYLLDVNARYDGSSKFRPENRWKFFYGVSGGWRITEEAFAKGIKEYVDELKLRASYGEVGNQNGISNYDGIQLYEYKAGSGAYIGSSNVTYIAAKKELVSTVRTWEKINTYNAGIDFVAFNNRLSGSFDLYQRKNNNMLVGIVYPGVLGGTAPQTNDGKFESKGYEGRIIWRAKVGDVNYHVGGTLTYMTNELKSGGNETITAGYNSTVNGYPLNSIFGYRYAGKIQDEETLEAYKAKYLTSNSIGMPAHIRLGDHMFADVNDDGKLDASDLVYLGSDDPKYSFSFDFGFEWNNFDFSAIFQGVGKRTILREIDTWKVPFRSTYLNTTNQSIGKVWSLETPNNRYPSYSTNGDINNYNYMPSSWSVENGAYLRLKNITIGYTLPKSILLKTKAISSARIYVSGADLWEKTYINDGWDPEATRKIEKKDRYPFNRTFTAGINVTF